ncbi:hypothetical protein ACJX0J_026243, partial [Zea mays]
YSEDVLSISEGMVFFWTLKVVHQVFRNEIYNKDNISLYVVYIFDSEQGNEHSLHYPRNNVRFFLKLQ